jgi:pimeloyl-ACP methyl ester carboxylesterase
MHSARPLAIIWVHGWGTNFYNPSYVAIGRALAERGFATISVNTRMHDIANVEKYTLLGKRVRGGGYWGVTSEDARDIAAWVNYAEQSGYRRVILVGHSAGWASVARYQADAQDRRIAGLVFASPSVGNSSKWDDPQLTAQAKKLVDDGAGEDLIRLPRKSYPSFISAATYLDTATTPREYRDFFGTETPNPAVMRVACPILAFFGSDDEVGGQKELDLMKSSLQRLAHGPSSVNTTMIANGNHEYVGEAAQVAETIARWAEGDPMRH